LKKLAIYTARARTAVERDGYTHEMVVIPQPEGPARLVLGLRHLYGGLEAIGADEPTRWDVVARVARDCVPAIRNNLMRDLVRRSDPARTSEIAAAVDMVTKTAHQHLEDLALLKLANRTKSSDKGNAPDRWEASAWLREYWPEPESERECTYVRVTRLKRKATKTPIARPQTHPFVHLSLTLASQRAATMAPATETGWLAPTQTAGRSEAASWPTPTTPRKEPINDRQDPA
jgi:hypothetical protein